MEQFLLINMSQLEERGENSQSKMRIVESQRIQNGGTRFAQANWLLRDNIQEYQSRPPIQNRRYEKIIHEIKREQQLIENLGKNKASSNQPHYPSEIMQNSSRPIEDNPSQISQQSINEREQDHPPCRHHSQMQRKQYQKSIQEKSNKIVEILQENKKLKIENQTLKNSKIMDIKNNNNIQENMLQQLKRINKLQSQQIVQLKFQNQKLLLNKNNHLQSYEMLETKYKQKETDYNVILKNYYTLETKFKNQRQQKVALEIEKNKLIRQIQLIQKDTKNSILFIQQNKEKSLLSLEQQYQQKYKQFEEQIKNKDKRYQLLLNEFNKSKKTETKLQIHNEENILFSEKRKMEEKIKQSSMLQKKENLILLLTQQTQQFQEKILNLQRQLRQEKMKIFERQLTEEKKINEKEEIIVKLQIELRRLQNQNKILSQNNQDQFFSPMTKEKSQVIDSNTADERNSRKSINHLEASQKQCKELQRKLLQSEFQIKRQIKLAEQKQQILTEKYQKKISSFNNQIKKLTLQQQLYINNINSMKKQQQRHKQTNTNDEINNAYREQIARLKKSFIALETEKKKTETLLQKEKLQLQKEIKNLRFSLKNMHQVNNQIDHLWEVKNKEFQNTTNILKEVLKA